MMRVIIRADGEIGRRTTLKMWRLRSCEFESRSAHSLHLFIVTAELLNFREK